MQNRILTGLCGLALMACSGGPASKNNDKRMKDVSIIAAPDAKKEPKKLIEHDNVRTDDYFWMRLTDKQKEASEEERDAQTQQVLDYLDEENAYLKEVLRNTDTFQKNLFDEMVARVKKDDSSVPVKVDGYWYYTRFEGEADYALYCRKKESMDAEEVVMLNGPEMAKGHPFFAIGGRSVSTNNRLLAYGVDTLSRRKYNVYFKDLETGELLDDIIENTSGGVTWANDNKTVFYTRKDDVTLRSYRIYRHTLGTDSSEDVLVYEEKDEEFGTFVYKTKSKKFLMIGSYHTLATEYRYLEADNPTGEFKIIEPRQKDHEYSVAHYEDHFYLATNWEAKNFRLMKTPIHATERSNWLEVIPHRSDVLLEGVEIFKDYLVLEERKNGLNGIRIKTWNGEVDYYMEFQDPAYTAYVGGNPEFDTKTLRYGYTSLTTPNSTYDFNMESKERVLLKQKEVLGGKFSVDNYISERLFATAKDGTKVPISLVYRKGFEKNGKGPLLLYAYGSYGSSMDAYFSSVRLSLLDRGFAFAIAHIRGGQEMGRHWYEDGKLLKKKNTFTDFIDCGEYLISEGFTSKEHLYAMGGSAGGLLMGAVMNMRPDLWNGVVAAVPFVDVVSTMWDETIPLTTGEFSEWGNPKDKEYYDYILSYSPYDNIKDVEYPNTLMTTGYWDSQVQYWEPAKWIARLRDHHQGDNVILMYCNMKTGHGGASGRFESYKEIALEYAFLLDLEGINE